MSQFFASGGQSIGVSAPASVLPNEYSGLISFRMDWLDLLAVEGTLKSFLQHHSSKAVEGRKQKVASLVAQTVKLLLAMRETWV